MSNGICWRDYIDSHKVSKVEAYLSRTRWCHDLEIPWKCLLQDTNRKKAPTAEWYALHLITERKYRWSSCIMAWGLNIVAADLADIQNQVMEVCHNIVNRMIPAAVSLSDLERTDMGSWKAQYLLEECFDCFERLYAHAEPIFPAVRVPRLWRLSAATALVLHCWNKAHNDLDKYQLSGSHDVRVQLDLPKRGTSRTTAAFVAR